MGPHVSFLSSATTAFCSRGISGPRVAAVIPSAAGMAVSAAARPRGVSAIARRRRSRSSRVTVTKSRDCSRSTTPLVVAASCQISRPSSFCEHRVDFIELRQRRELRLRQPLRDAGHEDGRVALHSDAQQEPDLLVQPVATRRRARRPHAAHIVTCGRVCGPSAPSPGRRRSRSEWPFTICISAACADRDVHPFPCELARDALADAFAAAGHQCDLSMKLQVHVGVSDVACSGAAEARCSLLGEGAAPLQVIGARVGGGISGPLPGLRCLREMN